VVTTLGEKIYEEVNVKHAQIDYSEEKFKMLLELVLHFILNKVFI